MLKKIQDFSPIFLLGLGATLAGCVVSAPLPYLGECADTEGLDIYEYGQVGIGSCLAGPTDLQVLEDGDGEFHLLVVNSNFEVNFRDGSLLAIPFSGIDLDRETNYMHEVGATALSLPTFPAGVGVSQDGRFALVSDRTADKLLGETVDRVYAVDLANLDAGELALADRGTEVDEDGHSYVPVPTDPFTVVTHPQTGLVYVLGLHTHQVSVLDESVSPIQVLDVLDNGDVSEPVFEDLDGSGSHADWYLNAFAASLAQDETWEIRFREGVYSLFLPDAEEQTLRRLDSTDARSWSEAVLAELGEDEQFDWSEGGFGRAAVVVAYAGDSGYRRMWVEGRDEDGVSAIGAAETVTGWATDWDVADLVTPVLEARGSDYESVGVGEPSVIVDGDLHVLFYTAEGTDGRSIGVVEGDGRSFDRNDDPALARGDGGWDGDEVYGPAALRWALTGEDLLYYTGSDGNASAIGLAVGEDGGGFERLDVPGGDDGLVFGAGEAGAWDADSVAYPAVIHDAGIFHMFYMGSDGATWQLGHATSFDGIEWERDPLNPLASPFDGELAALGAVKTAEGEYFRVEGSISGAMSEAGGSGDTVAIPGETFASGACPMMFTIVDRHILGRGEDGEDWEDGSGGPAVVPETDGSFTLIYVTVEDSRHLLGQATGADGFSFERQGPVAFTDSVASGDLEGVGGPALLDHDGERLLAFHGWRGTDMAIYAATGEPEAGTSFTPLAGGAPVLEASADGWDGSTVTSPSLVAFGGELWMFYEGTDGANTAIGAARFDAASETFERVGSDGLVFTEGGPGDWDDGWVGDPHVRMLEGGDEDGLLELTYVGYDGLTERIGRATSPDGQQWTRHTDANGVPAAILGPDFIGFDSDGCFEPFVLDIGGRPTMWYEGLLGTEPGVPRLGMAVERGDQVWVKAYERLQRDDGYVVSTTHGDGELTSSIDLGDGTNLVIDGALINGSGVSDMALTPDGRFLLVSNKLHDNIYVIDVLDDTDGAQVDGNYHQIEAIIQIPNHYDVTGTRGMVFAADSQTLYLLLAPLVQRENPNRLYGPEAVLVLDISSIEDDSEPQVYDDLVVGVAATARGVEEDVGNPTIISGGPTNLVLSPDESLAYVAHYNDNSVHVYRLDAGRDPVLIQVVEGMGDEPFDVALSPDGRHLFVANYVGELEGPKQSVVHSTVTVVDVDPASPTYHQIVTTLRNRDAW